MSQEGSQLSGASGEGIQVIQVVKPGLIEVFREFLPYSVTCYNCEKPNTRITGKGCLYKHNRHKSPHKECSAGAANEQLYVIKLPPVQEEGEMVLGSDDEDDQVSKRAKKEGKESSREKQRKSAEEKLVKAGAILDQVVNDSDDPAEVWNINGPLLGELFKVLTHGRGQGG